MNDNFEVIASFPELKNIPVIIGESDPEGCAACGMTTNPENAYRNGTLYSSYTAESIAREYDLANFHDIILIGAVNWSFEFGNLAYDFKAIRDSSVRGTRTDINALAAKNSQAVTVLVWNYHDEDINDAGSPVELVIKGIPAKKIRLNHYRIDSGHSNSYEVWKAIGSPQNPTAGQIAQLEKSGQLQMLDVPQTIRTGEGVANIKMQLPRQAVSLVKLTYQ